MSSSSASPVTHRYSSSPPSTHTPFRSVLTPRGIIPQIHPPEYDSGIRKPESNTENFLKEKAIEQWAITKQTYRTLPLIEPRPKVRRDYPTGSYLRHMDGPTWHDIPKTIVNPNPPKLQEVMNRYGHDVQHNNPNVVHLQYNSPINLHSHDNVSNLLMPRPVSPGPVRPGSVPPHHYHTGQRQLQKPITVDITQSPTYNLLQEEEENRPLSRASPRHSHSPIGLHSPSFPKQTPYFKSLMNSLLPNPGV